MPQHRFNQLLSDEVLAEAALASDAASLWRRLWSCDDVRSVARQASSDDSTISRLCEFAAHLVGTDYDPNYRHPHEAAICASLAVVAQSPIAEADRLFKSLINAREPHLAIVQRFASFCRQHTSANDRMRINLGLIPHSPIDARAATSVDAIGFACDPPNSLSADEYVNRVA